MIAYSISLIILNLLLIPSCESKKEINLNHNNNLNYQSYSFEIVAENLNTPWSIVFTSNNRILVTERIGKLSVIENMKLLDTPLKVFNDISNQAEEGLMGLAIDPDYENNKFIYVSYAYKDKDEIYVKVVRFKDIGYKLDDDFIIFDKIPAARIHAGCRIKFGPDKKLYITTGDAAVGNLAQDLNKLNGKILRINSDGSIPDDNPFPNSPVWSFGHRNPQGIDWYPETNILWSTEHGPSGFDGPGGGDEVNNIVKGGNYGWPVVSHNESAEGMISPIIVFTPAEAPASAVFYKYELLPDFKNCFLFGCLRGNGIIVVNTQFQNGNLIPLDYKKIANNFGRIREVTQGIDGYIYFSTSNKDGRGNPKPNDDKIYRIIPKLN